MSRGSWIHILKNKLGQLIQESHFPYEIYILINFMFKKTIFVDEYNLCKKKQPLYWQIDLCIIQNSKRLMHSTVIQNHTHIERAVLTYITY